jgi:hypothetical protein
MPKTTNKSKAPKPRRASRSTIKNATPSIPISVATVERFVNGIRGDAGVEPDFVAAWAFLPELLRAILEGTTGDIGHPNVSDFVEGRVRAEAQRRASDEPSSPRGLANILEWIEDTDSDYLPTLQLAFMEPAFNLGIGARLRLDESSHLAEQRQGGDRRCAMTPKQPKQPKPTEPPRGLVLARP